VDHRPLLSIFGIRKDISVYSVNRPQRWTATLLGYDLRIGYRKSTDFGQTDAFSRLISAQLSPDEEVVVAALQAEFDMDVLTSYLPVTSDFSASTLNGHSSKGSTNADSPSRSRKDVSVQGTCGYFICAADQYSQTPSPRTSGDPTNEVTRAQIHVLAGHGPRHWRNGSSMRALLSIKAASQGNTALVSSSNKTLGAIHIDFTGPNLGRHFLFVVDIYSKYPNAISVSSTTSRQTVAIIRKLCAQHGVPETIVSDTGAQFTSHEFREFCKAKAIGHILSPPPPPPPNQIDGPNALSTSSSAASWNWEGKEMWIKFWIHSCWLTGRHPAPLFHNNVVLLNCSLDVSPGRHWIYFFFWPSNQQDET
jgi:hypothetical protein